MNRKSSSDALFRSLAKRIRESDNNPDILVINPSHEAELFKDANITQRSSLVKSEQVAMILGLEVYVYPDVEYPYIMDTRHEGWPKPPDHRDD